MFKFKKGDTVVITTGNIITSIFGGPANTVTTTPSKITGCREYGGVTQYKVKGFTGWWNENDLQEVK